ncbi:hypothetical protein NEHOM01_2129 [Nematocida homosporus]|uniref:uncharacterized protein n=1 Tax=Nematocida homosporus TaxID=1912981 RepID=UPI00221F24C3|nr:uncharacterized protein NEHOM01_2129 [Nematocida homosporus]KAI5187375.1 hypothetical protein NEHOM01_2129 [Nematocida homosporus]
MIDNCSIYLWKRRYGLFVCFCCVLGALSLGIVYLSDKLADNYSKTIETSGFDENQPNTVNLKVDVISEAGHSKAARPKPAPKTQTIATQTGTSQIGTSQTSTSQTITSQTGTSQTGTSQTGTSQTAESQTSATQTTESQAIATQSNPTQTTESQTGTSQTTESQTIATQTGTSQTAESQAIATQSNATQTTESQTGTSQTTESQTTATQAIATQTTESQTIETQTGTSQTTESQAIATQTTESQTIETQTGTSQTTESQAIATQSNATQTQTHDNTMPDPDLITRLQEMAVIAEPSEHSWESSSKTGQVKWVLTLNAASIIKMGHDDSKSDHLVQILQNKNKNDCRQCLESLKKLQKIKSSIPMHIMGSDVEYNKETIELVLLLLRVMDVPHLKFEWTTRARKDTPISLNTVKSLISKCPHALKQRPNSFIINGSQRKLWNSFLGLIKTTYNLQKS